MTNAFPYSGSSEYHSLSEDQAWPCQHPSNGISFDSLVDTNPVEGIPPRLVRRRDKSAPLAPPPCAPIHSGSILQNFQQVLSEVDLDNCVENGENAFYVCDLAEVYRQALRWKNVLSDRVHPFYAVKCNPDPEVLRLLAGFGTGFDCASHAEIATVLSLGVDPCRIIYANPCKAASFVRHASDRGVRMMTFDNVDELVKVKQNHSAARLVLRILTDDSGSLCRFGDKFGAPQSHVRPLLIKAKELDLDVMGISFHVGSGCSNPDLFVDAIRHARAAFDAALELGMKKLELLDIGGGFGHENFEVLAGAVTRGLDMYFPKDCGVRVIAEPGRYFVSQAFELATNIIARRINANEGDNSLSKDDMDSDYIPSDVPRTLYYVNDGVYGAFNCIMFDHQVVQPQVLTLGGQYQAYAPPQTTPRYFPVQMSEIGLLTPSPSSPGLECQDLIMCTSESENGQTPPPVNSPLANTLGPCNIFGPSCDSIDLICSNALLPVCRLDVGDWLRWQGMGAYTICAASQFNGFKLSQVRYTIDEKGEKGVEQIVRGLIMLTTINASALASQQERLQDNQ